MDLREVVHDTLHKYLIAPPQCDRRHWVLARSEVECYCTGTQLPLESGNVCVEEVLHEIIKCWHARIVAPRR
jgi:hypothetical protein